MAVTTSKNFCPNILYGGGPCEDASCLGEHDVRLCELCVVICSPASNYDSHIRGRQHLANTAKVAPLPFVKAQSVRCPPCAMVVNATEWTAHISGESHRKHQQLAALRAAYEIAESDKQGVSVSHAETGVDFGVVNLEQAGAGESRVQLSVSSLKLVTLIHVRVRARVRSHVACFKTEVTANSPLYPDSDLHVPIVFQHNQLGRYEARLELVFQTSTGREFIIARRLLAIVGESTERESLKPVAPYTRAPRVSWEYNKLVLSGDAPPRILPQTWTRDLLPFSIPVPLAEILRSGSYPDIHERLSEEYFPEPLALENHQVFFANLLWIEEARMVEDLRVYDKQDVEFEKDGRLWSLHVHGLAEGRPSVSIGDAILAQQAGVGTTFRGLVHEIRQEDVLVSFHPDFPGAGQRFNVGFQLNRIPLRRQHQALVAKNASPQRLLFPNPGQEGLETPVSGVDSRRILFNSSIGNNVPQLIAVQSITQLRPGSAPFNLFGPPGTGKTVTIVEAIHQLLDQQPNARILACAPSNSAADILALRLLTLSPEEMFRCNAAARVPASVPPELTAYCHRPGNVYTLPQMDTLMRFKVIVSTCNNASFAYNIGMPVGHFTHIFVDEAGQASEPEILTAIKPLSAESTRIVLSGDPKQLGPVIRSSLARRLGLETSYLERLMDLPLYSAEHGRGLSFVKLVKNYRSHGAILRYPNEKFYNSELEVCGHTSTIDAFLGSPHLVSPDFPVVFHAISGTNDREASSPSYFNIDEAVQVKAYVVSLLRERRVPEASEIGVITPYHAQVRKIRQLLRNADLVDVKVGSVEEFQGQERKVIIVSTVRSSTDLLAYDARFALGFLSNARRFNVAMTRAKALLIVIGDAAILSIDPLWREFMNYVHLNHGWRGDDPTWDVNAPVDADADYADELREALAEDMNAVMAQLPPEEDIEAEANLERGFQDAGAGDENEWEAGGGDGSEWT
ncbi:P-loop containing nucleoside triphosphate hydrolase protein [Dichomitus squalens]|uniref:RNA helicase n=1 Tax=Dichomitus squalens TaxID=114155 RepID=A0A4Q9MPI8_9APHY|nr:P-loop containing nucleoside triphosphate hydrolase protein [Dichomitus squalens]TBU54380.1 P-loop containing nucleoside triphosphate hydrolase protein [Dichomitus squalens]